MPSKSVLGEIDDHDVIHFTAVEEVASSEEVENSSNGDGFADLCSSRSSVLLRQHGLSLFYSINIMLELEE